MRTTLYAFILLLLFNTNVSAQFGTIDSSFSQDGKVVTNYHDAAAYCVVMQPDGKILLGGRKYDFYDDDGDFLLTRYNVNGNLDTLFGTNGIVITNFGGSDDEALAIAIQKDSKILLAGRKSIDNAERESAFAIARYNSEGNPDLSFGTAGKMTSEKQHILGIAKSIIVLNDNKILVGGTVDDPISLENFLCVSKYSSNGSPDSSFGKNGLALINFGDNRIGGSFTLDPVDILLLPDGKILIGCTLQPHVRPYTFSDFVIARINENGIIDSSFGTNGIIITDVNNSFDEFGSFLLLPGGKIIVSGNTSSDDGLSPQNDSIFVMRFEKNGFIDSNFGKNGRVIFSYKNKGGNTTTSSALLPTNEILISGYSIIDSAFLLTALNKNGFIDSSFGVDGFTITPFKLGNGNYGDPQNEFAFAYAMNLAPDGKIVLAGDYKYQTYGANDYTDLALARYYGQTVLPIALSSFTATKKQSSVLLYWQTTNETNNNYFSLERSNNNNNDFKEIARVNSKGNSSQTQQYSYEDLMPLNGNNYYRLKQVDKNGNVTTSKIVLVDFSNNNIRIYPNPAFAVLNIEGLKQGTKTNLIILNTNGVIVVKASTDNSNYSFNIRSLPAGNYFVKIKNEDIELVKQFIKR